jgi:hypothetical protein
MVSQLSSLLRPDGSVVVPGRVAEPMLRLLTKGLLEMRRTGAGGALNSEASEVLLALQQASIAEQERAGSADGTEQAESAIVGNVLSDRVTSSQAAATPRSTT